MRWPPYSLLSINNFLDRLPGPWSTCFMLCQKQETLTLRRKTKWTVWDTYWTPMFEVCWFNLAYKGLRSALLHILKSKLQMELPCCICGIMSGANSHIKCTPALMTLSLDQLFVVLMENWHGFIVSSNKNIYMPWFDLCCSISNIKNSMQQNLTLIRHHLPGEGNGNALQYSCLENPIDRGAWWAMVHRDAKSDTAEWLHSCSFFKIFFSSFLDEDYF